MCILRAVSVPPTYAQVKQLYSLTSSWILAIWLRRWTFCVDWYPHCEHVYLFPLLSCTTWICFVSFPAEHRSIPHKWHLCFTNKCADSIWTFKLFLRSVLNPHWLQFSCTALPSWIILCDCRPSLLRVTNSHSSHLKSGNVSLLCLCLTWELKLHLIFVS